MADGFVLLRPFEPGAAPAAYAAVRESLPAITQWMTDLHEGLPKAKPAALFSHQIAPVNQVGSRDNSSRCFELAALARTHSFRSL